MRSALVKIANDNKAPNKIKILNLYCNNVMALNVFDLAIVFSKERVVGPFKADSNYLMCTPKFSQGKFYKVDCKKFANCPKE